MSANAELVRALVARLPFDISNIEEDPAPWVQLTLDTPAGALVVRLTTREPGRRAFALTRSFALSYVGEPPRAALEALVTFARRLAALDPGGLAFVRGAAPKRRLGVLGEDPGGSWSRAVFDRSIAGLAGRTFESAVLVVTQSCGLACQFCPSKDAAHEVAATNDVDGQLDDLVHQLDAARRLGARRVNIGGNDVLQYPRALELFEAAGALGYEKIVAQSPGLAMADPAFTRALAKTPLTLVEVPLYGASAEAHDRVTGTPGSFDRLCAALDNARSVGRPTIGLRTLALRSTLSRLDDLVAFAQRRFGLELEIRQLTPNRVGERDHLVDAPSFAELAPMVARHATRCDLDLPLCLFPAEHRDALLARLRGFSGQSQLHLWDQGIVPGSEDDRVKRDRERVFDTPCDDCTQRTACRGIVRAHFDLLGTEGITPVR